MIERFKFQELKLITFEGITVLYAYVKHKYYMFHVPFNNGKIKECLRLYESIIKHGSINLLFWEEVKY